MVWVIYVLGAAALAVGAARLERVGVGRFGLRTPPLTVVALWAGGAAAVLYVVLMHVDSAVWAFAALLGGWLPAIVVSFAQRHRSRTDGRGDARVPHSGGARRPRRARC